MATSAPSRSWILEDLILHLCITDPIIGPTPKSVHKIQIQRTQGSKGQDYLIRACHPDRGRVTQEAAPPGFLLSQLTKGGTLLKREPE